MRENRTSGLMRGGLFDPAFLLYPILRLGPDVVRKLTNRGAKLDIMRSELCIQEASQRRGGAGAARWPPANL